jgi:hypothetical protein
MNDANGASAGGSAVKRWYLLDHFFIRRTGFPFEWIDRLRFRATAEALGELQAADRALERESASFREQLYSPLVAAARASGRASPVAKFLGRCASADRDRSALSPVDVPGHPELSAGLGEFARRWNDLVDARRRCQAKARASFDEELRQQRGRLREIARHRRFREAIFLSSPDLLGRIETQYLAEPLDARRNSKCRSWERLLISYLQRFCTKNEATAFFGPSEFARARWDWRGRVDVALARGEPPYASEGSFAYWGAAALASAMSRDPSIWPWLRPRRDPLCERTADGFRVHWVWRQWPAEPLDQAIFEAANGEETVRALSVRLGGDSPGVEERIRLLTRQHVLKTEIEIPGQSHQPLAWLADLARLDLAQSPRAAHWLEHIERFEALRREFGGAPLERKSELLREAEALFQQLTRAPVRRGQGHFYADRLLLSELCHGSIARFDLGADFLSDLEKRIQPILDYLAVRSCTYQRVVRAIGADLCRGERADQGGMPYAAFIQAVERLEKKIDAKNAGLATSLRKDLRPQQAMLRHFPAFAAGMEDFDHKTAEMLQRNTGGLIELTAADFSWLDRSLLEDENLFASPDFMIMAKDPEALARGEYKIVLSEVHDSAMVWQGVMLPHPEFQELAEQIKAAFSRLPRASELAYLVGARIHRNFVLEYPGLSVELSHRSAKSRDQVLPISDLRVASGGGLVHLESAALGRRLQFSLGGTESLHLAMFVCPPVKLYPLEGAPELVQAQADDAAKALNHSEAFVYNRLGNHSARAERSGVEVPSTAGLRPYARGDRDPKSRSKVRTSSGARHMPRIELDGIVIQRERWRFESSELLEIIGDASGFESMARMHRFRTDNGIPERTFVRASGELKPFFIDWSNFLLLELLAHLARANDTLTVTEMLPGPEGCWLRDEEGRYTCEIRSTCFFLDSPVSGR